MRQLLFSSLIITSIIGFSISRADVLITDSVVMTDEVVDTIQANELDPLFTQVDFKPQAKSSAWPEDISENMNDALADDDDGADREIASVKKLVGKNSAGKKSGKKPIKKSVGKSATKWQKNGKSAAKKTVSSSPSAKPNTSPTATGPGRVVGRRSHMPLSVKDGFEIRVKASGIVTTFWVSRRGNRQDLLYANSAQSKASIALSPENFRVLQAHALKIPESNTSVKNCPMSNMQIHIISNGVERTSTFCVEAKSEGAEKLRNLGNTLVVWVR